MTEVSIRELDGAKLVKVSETCGQAVVQVWFGGVTVNVYVSDGVSLEEVECWTMFDEQGYAPDADEIEEQMKLYEACVAEEVEER